ncbi:MAG: HAD-IIB family hydrolase [Pseudomonadota bacterium]
MFFLALAADYDGTLAHHGSLAEETILALRRLKQSGRRLLMVTGRELADLEHACPHLGLFDRIVAENGGVIHDPATGAVRTLGTPPPAEFVAKLVERKVEPISVGHCIVATWEPHQAAVLETIQSLGLELNIVFNKGAVMVLPAGVTKASGLAAALAELGLSAHNVVGVGDAENDHAFLHACGCAAAVANALPTIKAEAQVRLSADHGAGVVELVQRLETDDRGLVSAAKLGLAIGSDRRGRTVHVMPHQNVLVVGESACGKTRFAKMLTERMAERGFEFCVFDPEGDYHGLEHSFGVLEQAPTPHPQDVLKLLRETGVNVVLDAVSLDLAARRRLISDLLVPVSRLHAETGRPHWFILDEAHQVLPSGQPGPELPDVFPAAVFVTVAPQAMSDGALQRIDTVIAFPSTGADALACLAETIGFSVPPAGTRLKDDEVLVWFRHQDPPALVVRVEQPHQAHRRHTGKYAVGDVGEQRSFHFRERDDSVRLHARNLHEFVQHSRLLDDAAWDRHLRRNDYSAWFRDVIRDNELAQAAKAVEDDRTLQPRESRARIGDLILSRYAAPLS